MKIVLYQCDWCKKREEPGEPKEEEAWPAGWAEEPSVCNGYAGLLCASCRRTLAAEIKEAVSAARVKCSAPAVKVTE